MNNKPFRNHISIVFERLGRSFWIIFGFFVLEFADSAAEIAEGIHGMDLLTALLIIGGILLVILLMLGWQLLLWAKTYISIQDHAIIIERHTLRQEKNTIGIKNISNVNTEQNLFEMLVGTCKVKLDTNSLSTADTTDVKIVLKKKDAENFRKQILELMNQTDVEEAALAGKIDAVEERAGLEETVIHGFYSMRLFSVVMLFICAAGTVNIISDTVNTGAAALSSVIIIAIFALSALWDIIKGFIQYYGFTAQRVEDQLYIQYGLIKKVQYSVPVDKINAVKFSQSPQARIKGMYMAELINVGMGDDEDGDQSFFMLYNKKDKVEAEVARLLPEFAEKLDIPIHKQSSVVWIVWLLRALIYTSVIGVIIGVAAEFWPEALHWVLLGVAGISILAVVFLFARYKTAGCLMGENRLRIVTGCLAREIVLVEYDKIQYIECKQSFLARHYGIQKANIQLLAAVLNQSQSVPYHTNEDAQKLIEQFKKTCKKHRIN